MTPDEVRMLDNQYAIVFIRGERPILDNKYDILAHPNVERSADGKGEPYEHGAKKDDENRYTVEIVDPSDYPDLNLKDIPVLNEYYEDFFAFDEGETEALIDYMNTLQEEDENENTQKN